jgi:hypothetical protein
MKKLVLAGAIAFAGCGSAAADTGSMATSRRTAEIPEGRRPTAADTRRIMYDFAACTVRKRRSAISTYLDTTPGSRKAEAQGRKLALGSCLSSGTITFEETSYRAAIYDVLYHMEFAEQGPQDFSAVPVIDYQQATEDVGEIDQSAVLRRLADCAVRKGPVEARKLISARIDSVQEAAAFSALVPSISQCMSADATIKFSKFSLRGYVGEALYRLSVAARGTDPARLEV